jgi:hypothetical protein
MSYFCVIMFLNFSVKLVNFQITIMCLFLLGSIKVMVWGPLQMVSLSGHQWFVYFIDDFSRTTCVYLLKDKSDVLFVFQMFHKVVQTQFNIKVKKFCSDNGDICPVILGHFFESKTFYTKPHVSILRSVAERKNRHLLLVTRSLMLDTHVLKSY